jgi:RNA polymerase sigma-70 factor (ECF subfamily)
MKDYFDKYFMVVVFFCVKLIKNREDAEEITVDTFVALSECIDNFKSEIAVRAFLFKTAKNKCINFSIKKKSHFNIKTFELSEDDAYFERQEISALVIEKLYENMHNEIKNLTPRQKEIIDGYLDGTGPSELSNRLGIKFQTVCNIKNNVVNKIRKNLDSFIKEYVNEY